MCASPQTATETVVYKSLAPRFVSSPRTPSQLAHRGTAAHFAESVSKPED